MASQEKRADVPTAADIAADFSLLDDWEDRYRYLIELGRTLPPLPEVLRTDSNKVRGCASQVWLATDIQRRDGTPVFIFLADSDAHIVRGLIAILSAISTAGRSRGADHRSRSGFRGLGVEGASDPAALQRPCLHGRAYPRRGDGRRGAIVRCPLSGLARHLEQRPVAFAAQWRTPAEFALAGTSFSRPQWRARLVSASCSTILPGRCGHPGARSAVSRPFK